MKKKYPWFKFNPTLWRGDEQLRNCSIAARGLWIEMLCLMHRATPYGHLLINCEVPTDTQLAVQTGIPIDQLIAHRDELDKAGVFSRTGKGVIYSRKMVDDEKKSNTLAKNGKNGGNPNLCKDKAKSGLVNQPDKPKDKPLDKPKTIDLKTKKESTGQESKIPRSPESYWWAMQIIRLDKPDYLAWLGMYGGTDEQFMDWLADRDRWYQTQPPEKQTRWFISTFNYLKKLQADRGEA